MPATKRPKPLYQRGEFRLYSRSDRGNLEIVWYDEGRGRERSASAGTGDHRLGMLALDRLYLESTGQRFCETCGRPFDGEAAPLLTRAIADYLLLSQDKAGYASSTLPRLKLAVEYIASTDPTLTCAQVDTAWVAKFRKWLAAKPVRSTAGKVLRARSIGHVEACVLQLAAAINATPGQTAQFKNEQPRDVASSPLFRAPVKMLGAMFRFCLYPEGETETIRSRRIKERASLLKYLRAAVATWARPEEVYDIGEKQWASAARVLDLNPPGRRQTRKYRTRVPIARQFAPFLDDMQGQYLPVESVRASWDKMRVKVGAPAATRGEAGEKLIRRSMATLVRRRIGEANWRQGEMMLGHVKHSVSDIYAIPDPANLGLALAATEAIIDEIELVCPGAFYRSFTANGTALKVVEGGLSD